MNIELTRAHRLLLFLAGAALVLAGVGIPLAIASSSGSVLPQPSDEHVDREPRRNPAPDTRSSSTQTAPGEGHDFEVARLPSGFIEASGVDSQSSTGVRHDYRAFIRGEDPDRDPDWAILRVTVRYAPFDAQEWISAYAADEHARSIDEGVMLSGPDGEGVLISRIDVNGSDNALLEAPLDPGSAGSWVLRFGVDGVQVIVDGLGVFTPDDLILVAEGIARG